MGETETRGDLEWGTIPRLLASSAERFGAASALDDVDSGVALSFTELQEQAHRAARGFIAAGVAAGDRVAIWAPNVWEWVVAALGLQCAGAVLVPINTRFKGAEAADILRRSRATALVTVSDFLDTDYIALLRGAIATDGELPDLRTIVCARGTVEGTIGWDAFLHSGSSVTELNARIDAITPDDVSDILFTSGTTGAPKGVVCTHAQALRAYRDWSEVTGLRAGDRYLVVNPYFHAFGYKAGWLACLMMGAVDLPHAVFDPAAVLGRIARDRISVIPGPPTLFQSILHHPHRASTDLSTLRLAVTGAASIPVDLIVAMRDDLGFGTVITGYGLTEVCGIATMCRHDDDPETIATTSGRPIPDVEVRIVDDHGLETQPGEPGEVVVRGYNVMRGYLDDPSATADTIDADGWLHTGDVGVMNDRGYLRITDRIKDLFIVGGFNAYPAEIEALMLRHPGLAQVAVIGVPDERLGEVGMAFVVPKPEVILDLDELNQWCRDEMANYKVPRHITIVDALPLNATGKVQKFVLRDRANR